MFITALIIAHLTTILVDEFEQSVKSMENYKSAINHINQIAAQNSDSTKTDLSNLPQGTQANVVLQEKTDCPGNE